jgi:hypothetical protein
VNLFDAKKVKEAKKKTQKTPVSVFEEAVKKVSLEGEISKMSRRL